MDVFASRGIGPADIQVAFAFGSLLVDPFAHLSDFEFFVVVVSVVVVIIVVVVIAVVFINLLTGDAFAGFDNRFGRERKLNTVVFVSVGAGVSTGRACLVVENSKVDGLSVLLGTVRSDVVLSVPVHQQRKRR